MIFIRCNFLRGGLHGALQEYVANYELFVVGMRSAQSHRGCVQVLTVNIRSVS